MSESEVRTFILDFQASHGELPTVKEISEAIGGRTATIASVLKEFRDVPSGDLRERIDQLDRHRSAIDQSQREVSKLLQLAEADEKAERARALFSEARELAEEAIKETRAEQRQRLESEIEDLEAVVEQHQPDLEATRSRVDELAAEYAELETRFGRKTPFPALMESTAAARKSWHGVQRAIAQAEQRISECRAELADLDLLDDALVVRQSSPDETDIATT